MLPFSGTELVALAPRWLFTLNAQPAPPGTTIECGRSTARPINEGFLFFRRSDARPYGKLFLFDARGGQWAAPRNQAECRGLAPTFKPGP